MWKKCSAIIALIIAIVCVALVNQENFFVKKAYKCYKENNIKCAIENYEKAFLQGYSDEEARNIYVNLLINSSLDFDIQNRMLNFKFFKEDDSANIKLDSFLYDLKREIHKKYSGNYIKQAVYNQKILRWGKLPITYDITADFDVPSYVKTEIERAFSEWQTVTEGILKFENSSENPNIIFCLEQNNPAKDYDKKFMVAFTTPEIEYNNLKKMEIKFYITNPSGETLSKNHIYNIALHEIAHALGLLGHSSDRKSIMYMTKDMFLLSEDLSDSLTEADINTVKLLYKIKPDITNSQDLYGEFLSEIILGSDEEINRVNLEEAKNYIKNAPTIVAGYIDLAEAYSQNKDYVKAIKILEQALKIADSEDIIDIVCYNLALTYFNIDHMEIAKEYINKSLSIEKTNEKRFLLAEILDKSGEKILAEKEYKYLVEKNPHNVEYSIALINLYITNKKYLKARKALSDFIKNNPSERNNERFKPYGILKFCL